MPSHDRSSPIRLIIFDCDGVLVDSEPLAMRVLLRTLAAAGLNVTDRDGFRNFLGRSLSTIVRDIDDQHGLTLSRPRSRRCASIFTSPIDDELQPMAGLLDVLPVLGVPFCVASSSQMERIETSLEITGLIDRFDPEIFSATLVGTRQAGA